MLSEQTLQILNMIITASGIPVAAILGSFFTYKYTEKLNRKNRDQDLKLRIFAELMMNRHDPVNTEGIKALNLIDLIFKDEVAVKEAWSKYYTYLSDARLNDGAGSAIRDEAKHNLLNEMAKCIEAKDLSNVDLRRVYSPAAFTEEQELAFYERKSRLNTWRNNLSQPIHEPEVTSKENFKTKEKTEQ